MPTGEPDLSLGIVRLSYNNPEKVKSYLRTFLSRVAQLATTPGIGFGLGLGLWTKWFGKRFPQNRSESSPEPNGMDGLLVGVCGIL